MATDPRRIDLGTPDIMLGDEGTKPTLEVGTITPEGVAFTTTREVREVIAGSPKQTVALFDIAHNYMLEFKSVEWNLSNMLYTSGSGVYTANIPLGAGLQGNRFDWGGSPCVKRASIFMSKTGCAGGALFFYFWKVASKANLELAMGSDTEHMFNYTFTGLKSELDWTGTGLSSNGNMFRLERAV